MEDDKTLLNFKVNDANNNYVISKLNDIIQESKFNNYYDNNKKELEEEYFDDMILKITPNSESCCLYYDLIQTYLILKLDDIIYNKPTTIKCQLYL